MFSTTCIGYIYKKVFFEADSHYWFEDMIWKELSGGLVMDIMWNISQNHPEPGGLKRIQN